MADDRRCPRCGKPLPPDVPAGICPACLLRAGLETGLRAAPLDDSNDGEVTFGFEPTNPGRVLETLARSIGSIPRVLLPDTAPTTRASPSSSRPRPRCPPPAERGDRYQLFGEIARGGMGAVLKGRDLDLGRDLAVKVLLEAHQRQARAGRAGSSRRRRSAASSSTRASCRSTSWGPSPTAGPIFTMKLVKGRTLAELLRERHEPARRPAAVPGDLRAGLPDDGLRPRPRRDPPRPEAVERHGRARSARCR